jgi:hypothetical protein
LKNSFIVAKIRASSKYLLLGLIFFATIQDFFCVNGNRQTFVLKNVMHLGRERIGGLSSYKITNRGISKTKKQKDDPNNYYCRSDLLGNMSTWIYAGLLCREKFNIAKF